VYPCQRGLRRLVFSSQGSFLWLGRFLVALLPLWLLGLEVPRSARPLPIPRVGYSQTSSGMDPANAPEGAVDVVLSPPAIGQTLLSSQALLARLQEKRSPSS